MNINELNLMKIGEKIDISEVSRIENHLKISFAPDYIKFILTNNGGIPEEDILFNFRDLSNDNDYSVINRFYSVFPENVDNSNNAVSIYLSMRKEKRIPNKTFSIAEDPSGNLILISLDVINFGHIYFWDHEIEFQDESYKGISFIAESFSKFLDLCFFDEE